MMEPIEAELNIGHEIQLLLNSRGTSASHNAQSNQPSCQTVRKRCSSCKDYGEQLVQCCGCSAAFHSECLDPPLPRNSVPNCDSFRCNECVWQAAQRRNQRLAQVQSGAESTISQNESRDSDAVSSRPGPRAKSKAGKPETEQPDQESLWIKAAQYVTRRNPTEFAVPNEVILNVAVPGSYKQQQDRSRSASAVRNAPNCYYCEQATANGEEVNKPEFAKQADTIRRGTAKSRINAALLIRCDYCEASFHLDCLPEPLTVAPSSNEWWMCPLHAEHSLDKRIIEVETRQMLDAYANHRNANEPAAKRGRFIAEPRSSCASISHRVTVWNELVRAPIDTHVTKADFVRKLHRDATWKRSNGASRFASFASLFAGWSNPITRQQMDASSSLATARLSNSDGSLAIETGGAFADATSRRLIRVPEAVRRAYRERLDEQTTKASEVSSKPPAPEQAIRAVIKTRDEKQEQKDLSVVAWLAFEKNQRRERIPIAKNVFRIGAGAQNDLCFSHLDGDDATPGSEVKDGDVHAVIVRDRLSSAFELLNYSESGTLVDGVLYAPECAGGWEGAAELRANSRVQMGRFTFTFVPVTDVDAADSQLSRINHRDSAALT